MKMYRIGFFAMVFALGAMFAATSAHAWAEKPESISTRYDFSAPKAQFAPFARRATRNVVRQFEPRQVRKNTERVLRAPLDAGQWIFDGVDRAGQYLIDRKGKNYTGFTCLQCGRAQRDANIATGYRDCAGGDLVSNWRSSACTTRAPAGAINSLRVWNNGQHIERVVGTCGRGMVIVADNNGPGGVGTVRCTPIAGATYHYPIKAVGDPRIDGPFFKQADPCRGRGPNPRSI